MFLIGTVAALLLQDNPGRDLGIDAQPEQESNARLRIDPEYRRERDRVDVA